MATGHSTSAQFAPGVRVGNPTAAAWARQALGVVGVGLGSLLVAALASADAWWSLLLWVPAGIVTGAVARRARLVWLAWCSVVAYYPVATALGVQRDGGPFWYLGAILGTALLSAGFAIGTSVRWRAHSGQRWRDTWWSAGRLTRLAILAAVGVGIVGFGGFMLYAGAVGSEAIMRPAVKWTGCDTPTSRYGWSYEAINYDPADDARLAAENPDRIHCRSQGTLAGNEVVTSDGIPIAGWYIPAASGIGPDGPTVLLAHGWKANKSEVLKYAPPFHQDYNLVVLDLRNGGRSGVADTTWGLHEQLDVRAMVDWLERTKHPSWIAAVGNSMGGVTVLAEAVSDPRIRALILDSMQASALASIGAGAEVENGYPSLPTSWAVVLGVGFRIGADWTAVDPVQTITRVGDRPVLLIHGTADALDRPAESADRNFHAALDAGVAVELEYCRGATHGAVYDRCPADWGRWATSFLEGARAQT